MLPNAVILILQETLEAALLIGVLLAVSTRVHDSKRWLPIALISGGCVAAILANQMGIISEWFDYAGQELLNALFQTIICLTIALAVWLTATIDPLNPQPGKVAAFSHCAIIIIFCAVVREGQEIILYLSGFMYTENFQKVLTGGALGFSIGASIGILLFYSLVDHAGRERRAACLVLLALFAGNMLSQSTLLLMQIDWLTQSPPIWNTSTLVAETSIFGQLLYALVGYEATPSPIQAAAYILGVTLVTGANFMPRYYPDKKKQQVQPVRGNDA